MTSAKNFYEFSRNASNLHKSIISAFAKTVISISDLITFLRGVFIYGRLCRKKKIKTRLS